MVHRRRHRSAVFFSATRQPGFQVEGHHFDGYGVFIARRTERQTIIRSQSTWPIRGRYDYRRVSSAALLLERVAALHRMIVALWTSRSIDVCSPTQVERRLVVRWMAPFPHIDGAAAHDFAGGGMVVHINCFRRSRRSGHQAGIIGKRLARKARPPAHNVPCLSCSPQCLPAGSPAGSASLNAGSACSQRYLPGYACGFHVWLQPAVVMFSWLSLRRFCTGHYIDRTGAASGIVSRSVAITRCRRCGLRWGYRPSALPSLCVSPALALVV